MLNEFCGAVQSRVKRYGFDWSQLIVALLPVVIEMISICFNKSADLQAFAEGKRGPLQLAGLRLKCRQVVQDQGVRGVVRIAQAAGSLQQAILEELDQRAQLAGAAGPAGANVYQQAIDEAHSVA